MRLSMTTPPHTNGFIITKGCYVNEGGKLTHHRRSLDTPMEFVGVDGEGVTEEGEHKYVLFGVGDKQISNENGLQWTEIFEFLYKQYRPKTAFVGFFLGYDFTQIFKTMPENRASILLTSEGRALRRHRIPGKPPHPVVIGRWYVDILGMKRLKIRPKSCECVVASCQCKQRPWMYVCDVGPFFQSSFLSVIEPKRWEGHEVVSEDEYAVIEMGKKARANAVLDDTMRYYNRLENEILARVMRKLDEGFRGIGIKLPASKWFGPGQASQAWLKKVGAPGRVEIEEAVPGWFLEAARMTYFGGWFEIMMHGIVEGESHEYDVNSAYPSVIRGLPCLLHGKYSHGGKGELGKMPEGDALVVVFGTVRGKKGSAIGSVLHRDRHGHILRPVASRGWYWLDEIEAGKRAGVVGWMDVEKWVAYEPCVCPPPMREIDDLYLKRLEVGKESPLGKAAKLVYNADYGKIAQSIGEPVYGNAVYASRITAGCRVQILDAIASHPVGAEHVAMVATDAVYFLTPHPGLTVSDKLGEWGHKKRVNLTLFKPGVYWDDVTREAIARGESPNFKARGFKASDLANSIERIDGEFMQWGYDVERGGVVDRGGVWPRVKFVPSFSMVTALQALRRGKWGTAGRVVQGDSPEAVPVVQDSDPSDKRQGVCYDICDGRSVWRSSPYSGMIQEEGEDGGFREVVVESCAYQKRFGMDDPWSDEHREQMGVTPDGVIVDVLTWMMREE
jgi:hypothetical protein